jgi:hypothetical protein
MAAPAAQATATVQATLAVLGVVDAPTLAQLCWPGCSTATARARLHALCANGTLASCRVRLGQGPVVSLLWVVGSAWDGATLAARLGCAARNRALAPLLRQLAQAANCGLHGVDLPLPAHYGGALRLTLLGRGPGGTGQESAEREPAPRSLHWRPHVPHYHVGWRHDLLLLIARLQALERPNLLRVLDAAATRPYAGAPAQLAVVLPGASFAPALRALWARTHIGAPLLWTTPAGLGADQWARTGDGPLRVGPLGGFLAPVSTHGGRGVAPDRPPCKVGAHVPPGTRPLPLRASVHRRAGGAPTSTPPGSTTTCGRPGFARLLIRGSRVA